MVSSIVISVAQRYVTLLLLWCHMVWFQSLASSAYRYIYIQLHLRSTVNHVTRGDQIASLIVLQTTRQEIVRTLAVSDSARNIYVLCRYLVPPCSCAESGSAVTHIFLF